MCNIIYIFSCVVRCAESNRFVVQLDEELQAQENTNRDLNLKLQRFEQRYGTLPDESDDLQHDDESVLKDDSVNEEPSSESENINAPERAKEDNSDMIDA